MQSALIVGLGSIGRRHARVLKAAGIRDIAGVDLRQDRREQARAELGIETLGADLKEMLSKKRYDAVYVTTPTAFHTPAAIVAAEAGANLLIEKPVAADQVGLDELARLVEAKGLTCYVAYCYRFAPQVERVKQIVDSGQLGRIYSARLEISTYLPDWHPWEDYRSFYMAKQNEGGGALLDESHGIDLLRWMFGEVESVFAQVSKISELEITSDDIAIMFLRFRSGMMCEAHFDLLGRKPRVNMELIGSKGTLLWDRIDPEVRVYDPQRRGWTIETFPADDFISCYDRQAAHFIDCVRNRREPRTSLADGRKTLDVLLAAQRSARTGAMVGI